MSRSRRTVAEAAAEAAAILDAALAAAGLDFRAYLGTESLVLAWSGQDASLLARYGAPLAACESARDPSGADLGPPDVPAPRPIRGAARGAARGAVCLALPYDDGPPELPPWSLPPEGGDPGPIARLGRFARADWYGELSVRAGAALAETRKGLELHGIDPGPRSSWRRLVNSPLPERPAALLSGLGRPCMNGLLAVEGAGPGCVLGLVLLPFEPPEAFRSERGPAEARDWHPACLSCSRPCAAACPGGALGPEGAFRRSSCLQHWASRADEPPPELAGAWGDLLYGCDACLEACPLFASARGFGAGAKKAAPGDAPPGDVTPDEAVGAGRDQCGSLGPGLPAAWLLRADEEELRARLAGTALGMAFIGSETLRRNARLASASRGIASADQAEPRAFGGACGSA